MKREDYVVAKYHSERVLQAKPSHAGSLLIAGASSYGLNRLEQAHRYLSTFLGQSPGHEVATKLLAVSQAKLDRRKRHARVLTPLLDDSIDDRSLLAVQDPEVERHRLMVAAGEVWRHFDGSEKPRERDANCEALSERIRSQVARSANSAGVPWIADLTDDRCAEQITADLEQALEEGQQADAAKLLLAQL